MRYDLIYCGTKVSSDIFHTYDSLGSIFLHKKQKKYFQGKKFNRRFGECSIFFTSKDPIMLSVVFIK